MSRLFYTATHNRHARIVHEHCYHERIRPGCWKLFAATAIAFLSLEVFPCGACFPSVQTSSCAQGKRGSTCNLPRTSPRIALRIQIKSTEFYRVHSLRHSHREPWVRQSHQCCCHDHSNAASRPQLDQYNAPSRNSMFRRMVVANYDSQ